VRLDAEREATSSAFNSWKRRIRNCFPDARSSACSPLPPKRRSRLCFSSPLPLARCSPRLSSDSTRVYEAKRARIGSFLVFLLFDHHRRRSTSLLTSTSAVFFFSFFSHPPPPPVLDLFTLLKQANELRQGSVIETETAGGLAQITKYLYTQGSGRQLGVVQATLRCLRTGNKTEARWRPGDSVLEARLDEEGATLLYREQGGQGEETIVLMSDETFEQFSLPASMLGSSAPFLADGASVVVSRAPRELGGDALSVMPAEQTAEVVVVSTPPPRTGAQSSYQKVVVSSSSDSKTSTTAEVSVPAHVKEGDRIVVDLRDASFVRRL